MSVGLVWLRFLEGSRMETAQIPIAASVTEYRVHTVLPIDAVHWESVTMILIKRFRLFPDRATRQVREFKQRFTVPLEPYWFSRSVLLPEYNRLIAAICEVHGADSITLLKDLKISLGPLSICHEQKIRFIPSLRNFSNDESVTSLIPEIVLTVFGRRVMLNSSRDVVLWRTLALIAAIALSVPFLGCFLYSFAVFMLFLESPTEVTLSAFDHASIGLALLCFFVGFAGLFGRAVVNTIGKLSGRN